MSPVNEQIWAFGLAFGLGMGIGFFFDVYRMLIQLFFLPKKGIQVGDLFFWLGMTGFVFFSLLWGDVSEVRAYTIMGLSLGLILYLRWLSPKILHWFLQPFFRVVAWIGQLINRILWLPKRIVLIPVGWIAKIFNSSVK